MMGAAANRLASSIPVSAPATFGLRRIDIVLEVRDIKAGYGEAEVLQDVSFTALPGEILCLLGRNGAGKTTTLKTVMGLLPLRAGSIRLGGEDIGGRPPHDIPRLGLGYIPQGRRLFTEMTVAENIEVGLMAGRSGRETREKVLEMFPRLRERLAQRAETLSGGEQQMLATARALCLRPKALLLDEPTEGLQPSMIRLIRDTVVRLRDEGVAVILVEQRTEAILGLADQVVFLENGRCQETVNAKVLKERPELFQRYLGV